LVTLLVGVAIALPGIVVMALGMWHLVFGATYSVPGTVQLQLHEGRYVVFENTATSRSYGVVTITNGHGVTIDASQVTVTSDAGVPVVVRNAGRNESIARNSDRYTSAVEFTTPRSGQYVLRFDTAAKTKVMVQPPLGELFSHRVPWLVAIGVGWLVALVGAVMLIVGSTRRGRVRRAEFLRASTSGLPPPQWAPDPLGERRLRYWDGARWTDHVAD
jgi:hypothetical protein